jgi:hypothetical protein
MNDDNERKYYDEKDMSVSKVKFITDEKLKVFINEIQTLFRSELEETILLGEANEYNRILEIQFMIREYIIKNQKRISFSVPITLKDRSPHSMTSLFGLYMMVVADLTSIKTVNDVLKQIDRNYFTTLAEKEDIDGSGNGACGFKGKKVVVYESTLHSDQLCCCSHSCCKERLSFIKNNITNYHVIIGCDCILKNKLIDKEIMRAELEKTVKFKINKAKKLAERMQLKMEKEELKRQTELRLKQEENNKHLREEVKEVEIKHTTEEEVNKRIIDMRKLFVKKIQYDTDDKFYIDVKYHQKEDAKSLGAWWDNDEKKWYIHHKSRYIYALLEKYYKQPFLCPF